MSDRERTGNRDLLYSRWHRKDSVGRFLEPVQAHQLGAIDIDWCEYCVWCNQPLVLVETQRSASTPKAATVTSRLAEMAGLECFSVSYSPTEDDTDIASFRVRQLVPEKSEVATLTPCEYAAWLYGFRVWHDCERRRFAA